MLLYSWGLGPDIETIIKFLDYIPYSKEIISAGIAGVFLVLIGVPIYRAKQGDNISIMGKVIIQPNKKLQTLTQAFADLEKLHGELNRDSKQKTNLIRLLSDISAEIGSLMFCKSRAQIDATTKKLYDFILPAIQTHITRLQDNSHKVAILIPKGNFLTIKAGMGYKPDEIKNIKLEISDSFAGKVLKTGERRYTGNVDEDPFFTKNVFGEIDYKSLACVPIKIKDEVIGVLSLDGYLENSFTENDISYLCFFANFLAIILKIGEYQEEVRANEIKKRKEGAK